MDGQLHERLVSVAWSELLAPSVQLSRQVHTYKAGASEINRFQNEFAERNRFLRALSKTVAGVEAITSASQNWHDIGANSRCWKGGIYQGETAELLRVLKWKRAVGLLPG